LACCLQAGAGSFNGEFLFHFSQARYDVEEEPAGRGTGVDGIREALELHTLPMELSYQVYEMLKASA